MKALISKTVLLDIDTQIDLFRSSKNGAVDNIVRLFGWAAANSINVMSTVLRVRRRDISPFGPGMMPVCIDGTEGERKLSGTLLPSRIDFGLNCITDLEHPVFAEYQQAIFEQRTTDILLHPRAERLITEIQLVTFIICGAGVSYGIAQAAIGLRCRGFGVIVASDAVAELRGPGTDLAYQRMDAKGVVFAKTAEILSSRTL